MHIGERLFPNIFHRIRNLLSSLHASKITDDKKAEIGEDLKREVRIISVFNSFFPSEF